ncbi:hypothetical protein A3E39_02235 [Candidatus Uhrbacteria bacterium RIFCSPHIGHO2_12_FULL_60_25]|uniref:DUF4145 domain-containing protein n=1 Tax=Candidatus Uhrbacteria bacterium RIFCSPHIGHO2_12_FULL_60_25 TaxID=1802399 RepID=A0A1F7UL84_9BACT|nr:MAG: hypothetical protein A3E39_02235 [Candidatus Uhrbacteria bacterium RIFCSPHIGHO2_12_FULL_60_25]
MEETIFNLEPATRAATSLPPVAIAVIAVLILLILAAMVIVLRRYLTQPEMHGMSREEIRARWEEIEKIGASSVMGGKMAIVEADKLLDSSLKSMTIPGETLGERLKFASYKYPELRKVWFAHKLRNQLVHEASFEISVSQAKAALHEYKKALRVIHVL